jgi:hypothetical protein
MSGNHESPHVSAFAEDPTAGETQANFGRPRPLLPGESNSPSIDLYSQGMAFTVLYEQVRAQDSSLPSLQVFLEKHAPVIEQMDEAATVQVEWCMEAKDQLNQRYGPNQYYVVTAERGARNIRYIMSTLGVETRPLWANTGFFYKDSPANWDNVARYLSQQEVDARAVLRDPRQLVMLDTGFQGTVIKGYMQYNALLTASAETNADYAARIAKHTEGIDEVITVGSAHFGLKAELEARGIAVDDFTIGSYPLAKLQDPEHIDRILKNEKELAPSIYGRDFVPFTDKLKNGKRLLFVTTEVDPAHTDSRVLQAYLNHKGVAAATLTRNISAEQEALLDRMDGYMVSANTDSFYGELIDPTLPFARRAQLVESGPTFVMPVSRKQIKADGNIEFSYLPYEEQLLAALYLDVVTNKIDT